MNAAQQLSTSAPQHLSSAAAAADAAQQQLQKLLLSSDSQLSAGLVRTLSEVTGVQGDAAEVRLSGAAQVHVRAPPASPPTLTEPRWTVRMSFFVFSLREAQLEQNSRNRKPSLSPIILQQQEQEQKAKMAASLDITQVMSKLSRQVKEVAPPPPPTEK